MKISLRTPATSANLGSGFDCLGLALDIWAAIEVDTSRTLARNDPGVGRLVKQGIDATFEGMGKAPDVGVEWDGAIPLARGLGASASLRAAGLLAGNLLLDNVHSLEALLEMGTRLEGFPDNICPTLFGGFQVNVHREHDVLHLQAPVPADLQVVVFVPDFEMPTQESRRRLPKEFSREDTVFNVSRAALLVAAMGSGRFDLLDEATQDRIHQPARSEIFPGLQPIMTAARQGGAAAAYLSGGGSTVAALVKDDAERVSRLMSQAAIANGYHGRSIITRPTTDAVSVVSSA